MQGATGTIRQSAVNLHRHSSREVWDMQEDVSRAEVQLPVWTSSILPRQEVVLELYAEHRSRSRL